MAEPSSTYTFLSWLRKGMAQSISEPDPLAEPVGSSSPTRVRLRVNIRADQQNTGSITRDVLLYGPGDITGINRRAIVKTEPPAGITNYESNYLPYIEFYDEDFPWRYTPASANGQRLRPWIMLIVLEAEEFQHLGLIPGAQLPVIKIRPEAISNVFPRSDQSWAWAHVQLNTTLGAGDHQEREKHLSGVLQSNPNIASSRVICPRRLKENTRYFAFLLPAFERGRLAGLGASTQQIEQIHKLRSSWNGPQQVATRHWPFYFEWQFKTGTGGDFESLVRKIKPYPELDKRIGKRLIDLQDPGYALSYRDDEIVEQENGAIYLEGALRLPGNESRSIVNGQAVAAQDFISALANLVNLDEDLKEDHLPGQFAFNPFFPEEAAIDQSFDDPVVTPPFYGKWHALQKRVTSDPAWYNQLNLDPQYRVAAGLGTQVVQRDQEVYVARAWQQFGDIMAANEKIRLQQLSKKLSESLYQKHLSTPKLDPARLMQITHAIHHEIKIDERTLFGKVDASANVPNAILHPAYLRLTRSGGPVMRRIRSRPKTVIFSGGNRTNMILQAARPYQFAGIKLGLPVLSVDLGNGANNVPQVFLDHFNRGKPAQSFAASTGSGLDLKKMKVEILQAIQPGQNYTVRMKARLSGYEQGTSGEELPTIMASPEFPEPMFEALLKQSKDYFIPNLDLIPNESFSLFETNRSFIEAYLVGLNHEMARELLWREFPTDQRGSYFKQFWNTHDNLKDPNPDIRPIHLWKSSSRLGDAQHSFSSKASNVVFAIRGELLRKYPNTIVYMQRAQWKDSARRRRKMTEGVEHMETPLFQAKVDPDIYFYGFNTSAEEAVGNEQDPGWFFVLKERSGEVRFGLDLDAGTDQSNWENLSWNDLPLVENCLDLERDNPGNIMRQGVAWGKGLNAIAGDPASGTGSAADMAWILYQKPFMVGIHAKMLLNLSSSQ